MSKNKKNANYKPAKQQPTKSNTNALTIGLIAAVLVVAGVIGFFVARPYFKPEDTTVAPTVPVEQNAAKNDTEDMCKYLEEKYGIKFEYVDTTTGMSLYAADGLHGLVAVMRKDVVHGIDGVKPELFTEKYADNGYLLVNQKKAIDYYSQFIEGIDLGTCKLMAYVDIVVNPSKVTADMSYTDYLQAIEGLTIPQLIVLTDKDVPETDLLALEKNVESKGEPITLRVFKCSAEIQAVATPSDILVVNIDSDDVLYYKRLNQEDYFEKETVPMN